MGNYTTICPKCGNERTVNDKRSIGKQCRSCINKGRVVKHGDYKTRLYGIWNSAKKRVSGSMNVTSRRYTEKGIVMCEEWKNDYLAFKKWALANGYSDNLTLDRKDNDGNYEPNNCRWTTKEVQSRNQRQISSVNTSGYKGVSKAYKKADGVERWRARIKVSKVEIALGTFESKIDAAKAYNKYIIENNLEHTLNKIEE